MLPIQPLAWKLTKKICQYSGCIIVAYLLLLLLYLTTIIEGFLKNWFMGFLNVFFNNNHLWVRIWQSLFGLWLVFKFVVFWNPHFFFFFYNLFMALPMAYGSFQAWGWIGAADAGLYHSHHNIGSGLRLWPLRQLAAVPDPLTH